MGQYSQNASVISPIGCRTTANVLSVEYEGFLLDPAWELTPIQPHLAPLGKGHATSVAYERIEAALYEFLDSRLSEFLVTLLALAVPDIDSPAGFRKVPLLLLCSNQMERVPSVDEFPDALNKLMTQQEPFTNVVVVVMHIDFPQEFGKKHNFPEQQTYCDPLQCGVSIGQGLHTGTLGLFFKYCGKTLGLTCAHVLGLSANDPQGQRKVYQPSSSDFDSWYNSAKRFSARMQQRLQRIEEGVVCTVQEDAERAGVEFEFCNRLKQDSDYMEVGQVVRFEKGVIPRKCGDGVIVDYAFFEILARHPIDGDNWDGVGPREGFLSTIQWQDLVRVGPIDLDMAIRKTGRSTGLTFGYVASLGSFKFGGTNVQHFLAIPEGIERNGVFGAGGDSGAGVVSTDGEAVGILYGGLSGARLQVILRQTSGVDLRTMKAKRGSEGDLEGVNWTTMVESVAIIMRLDLLMKRSGLEGLELLC